MRRIAIVVSALAAACCAAAQAPAPPSPGSTVLVEDAGDWDGRSVTFTGEAIGEAMRRGPKAWIHLNDDAYGLTQDTVGLAGANGGIGVWVDAEQAARVELFGDNKHHGDIVEVAGTFHAACPQHGGDLDIHADTLRVVSRGHETDRPVARARLHAAGVMVVLTALLFLLRTILRRRRGSGA